MSATICGSEDRANFANCRSVVYIRERNAPQSLRRTARLDGPVISAIASPDDCSVIANQMYRYLRPQATRRGDCFPVGEDFASATARLMRHLRDRSRSVLLCGFV